MSDKKFKPGDRVYVAYLRINLDEVDHQVIRGRLRRYVLAASAKHVCLVDHGDGRSMRTYEEDCFRTELEAVDRVLGLLRERSERINEAIVETLDRRDRLDPPKPGDAS